MTISLFALGAAFIGGGGSTLASVVAIVSLMAYVASFAISLGPIFWLLNAEIYPLSVRSKAAGLGTMANWTFNFIVSLTFLLLIEALGRSGAFWFYGGIGILTSGFCWKFVPETKGKHLEDIQADFQARVDEAPPLLRTGALIHRQLAPRSAPGAATLRGCASTRSSPRGGRPSRSSSSRRRRRRRPSSSTRPRASSATSSSTSSRSPTAPAARPATARSRSPRR